MVLVLYRTFWSEYNKSLKNRGDITFWLSDDALGNWIEEDLEIKPKGLQYTTVSRRIRNLPIGLVYSKPSGNINIIFNSTGT